MIRLGELRVVTSWSLLSGPMDPTSNWLHNCLCAQYIQTVFLVAILRQYNICLHHIYCASGLTGKPKGVWSVHRAGRGHLQRLDHFVYSAWTFSDLGYALELIGLGLARIPNKIPSNSCTEKYSLSAFLWTMWGIVAKCYQERREFAGLVSGYSHVCYSVNEETYSKILYILPAHLPQTHGLILHIAEWYNMWYRHTCFLPHSLSWLCWVKGGKQLQWRQEENRAETIKPM